MSSLDRSAFLRLSGLSALAGVMATPRSAVKRF